MTICAYCSSGIIGEVISFNKSSPIVPLSAYSLPALRIRLRRGSVKFDIVDTKAPKSTVTQSDNKVVADGYYIVKKGDSLWRIATNHGITVDELCKLNNIKSTDIIKPGDKLKVKR